MSDFLKPKSFNNFNLREYNTLLQHKSKRKSISFLILYLILLYRCPVLLFYGVLRLFYSLFAEKLFQRTDAEYMLRTFSVGYFANAQYDVLFIPYRRRCRHFPRRRKRVLFSVILSMSSEQTCLQGFASDDIHKAQAFCKNAKRQF